MSDTDRREVLKSTARGIPDACNCHPRPDTARPPAREAYNEPLPSITEFGFSHDKYFEKILSAKKWPGISYSEELLKKQAKKKNLPLHEYRNFLNKKFIKFFEWQKEQMKNKKSVKDDQDNIKQLLKLQITVLYSLTRKLC